jgi:hypothetical protein
MTKTSIGNAIGILGGKSACQDKNWLVLNARKSAIISKKSLPKIVSTWAATSITPRMPVSIWLQIAGKSLKKRNKSASISQELTDK